jgi:organic radical activating enzyme
MVAQYVVRQIEDGFIGDGAMAGTRVARIVFGGCNYWDGTIDGRRRGGAACAKWCDEDFNSTCSKSMRAGEIADEVSKLLGEICEAHRPQWIQLSGGEPLMFVDEELIGELMDYGFKLFLETNCSLALSSDILRPIEYISARPKLEYGKDQQLRVPSLGISAANELVIALPGSIDGKGWSDEQLHQIEMDGDWDACYVIPMDPTDQRSVLVTHLRGGYERPDELDSAVKRCLDWVRKNPSWKIGVQLNKVLNL